MWKKEMASLTEDEIVLNVEKEMSSLTEDEIVVCAECGKRNGLTD